MMMIRILYVPLVKLVVCIIKFIIIIRKSLLGKRKVARPNKIQTDNIQKEVGKNWMNTAKYSDLNSVGGGLHPTACGIMTKT